MALMFAAAPCSVGRAPPSRLPPTHLAKLVVSTTPRPRLLSNPSPLALPSTVVLAMSSVAPQLGCPHWGDRPSLILPLLPILVPYIPHMQQDVLKITPCYSKGRSNPILHIDDQ